MIGYALYLLIIIGIVCAYLLVQIWTTFEALLTLLHEAGGKNDASETVSKTRPG